MSREVYDNPCDAGMHRYFVITDGTVEGLETIKVYSVIACTVCADSRLLEHIMVKDADKLTQKGK